VLRIEPETGRVRVLYRRSSRHNFFLVTERCNNYCLMCSQPPKSVDDEWSPAQMNVWLALLKASPVWPSPLAMATATCLS
jgi:hypothetical protein